MVLAKCDLTLAKQYAELVEDKALGARIYQIIATEWQATVAALELITSKGERLSDNPTLARSIAHRFPYIDPIHHLQIELIKRLRSGSAASEDLADVQLGIHLSINGIASGLRNTG
jgi:phosphoenolpyruvate carboxylase